MNSKDENKVNRADAVDGVGKIIETAKGKGYLIETGQTARKASVDALKKRRRPVLMKMVELVREAREHGMTRDELAEATDRAPHGVQGSVLALIADGELFETKAMRPTRWRGNAIVLVHRDYRPEGIQV